jgi:hypothetical protein
VRGGGRGGGRVVGLWLGGLLVVIACWSVRPLLLPVDGAPPPGLPPAASEPDAPTSAGLAVAVSLAPAAAPSAEREPMPSGRTAVLGALRLQDGEPLPGQTVQLQAMKPRRIDQFLDHDGAPPLPAAAATTADDGTFAFEDLAAGRYRVSVGATLGVAAEEFDLAAGERRHCAFVVPGVLVDGSVHAGAATVPFARYIVHRAGEEECRGRADAHGAFALAVPPGAYEVQVFTDVWPVAPIGVHAVVVPHAARTTWRLAVAATDLEVVVHDADGNPAAAFTARLDGVLAGNGERAVREFAGRQGRAAFERIPAGRWTVAVRSAGFVAPPPRELVTQGSIPRERVDFLVAPATVVPLVLQRPDGSPWRLDPALLPWLDVGDQHVPCTALGDGERGARVPIGYAGVPIGRAVLRLQDREQGGEHVFLPFDPLPERHCEVRPGQPAPLVLDVVPRAFVDLRACEASGREDFTARLQVFAGQRAVCRQPEDKAYRWAAHLPPGDYRVTVERPGHFREHALCVDRADVTLRLRP